MKKKKLILVAILLVITLNINYLGVAGKKVTITSKEYKVGNSSNLVLDKILSDNELKEEIPHMFNYASNGNYFVDGSGTTLNNPDYITKGLYSGVDEDGTTYYYRGDVDNNNMIFGAYDEDYYVFYHTNAIGRNSYFQSFDSCLEAGYGSCVQAKLASAGDLMYWKIVRINGDGSIRLIYDGPGYRYNSDYSSSVEATFTGVVGVVPYNLSENDPKYTGYTYDNGTASFIKKEVETWYNNTLASNPNYDKHVILGNFCSDSSGYNYNERGGYANRDRLEQYGPAKDNAPTFICPETSESYGGSYNLKVGLITADESIYAGDSASVTGNDYLNQGKYDIGYWSMTPSVFTSLSATAHVWSSSLSMIAGFSVLSGSGVRPVINLSTEGMTLEGEGTIDDPYVLVTVETSHYDGKVTIEEGSNVDDNEAFEEELDLTGNITWTSEDESIAIIENGRLYGLKEGVTTINGVRDNGITYEIEVTVTRTFINVPLNILYIGISIGAILVIIIIFYLYHKKHKRL